MDGLYTVTETFPGVAPFTLFWPSLSQRFPQRSADPLQLGKKWLSAETHHASFSCFTLTPISYKSSYDLLSKD